MSPLGEENEVLRGEGVCLKLCGWLRGVVGTLPDLPRPELSPGLSRLMGKQVYDIIFSGPLFLHMKSGNTNCACPLDYHDVSTGHSI